MKKLFLFLLVSMFLVSFTSAFNWTDNINSYYKLDADSFADATSKKLDALNSGTTNTIGKILDGREFNSVDNISFIGNNITGNPAFSYSFWFNPDAIGTDYTILSPTGTGGVGSNTPTTAYYISLSATGKIAIILYDKQNITTTNTLTAGIWNHVVVTKAPGAPASTTNIYINGNNETLTVVGGTSVPSYPAYNLTSSNGAITGTYVAGKLDELGIWNRTLSLNEVTELYNAGNALSYGSSNELIAVTLKEPLNQTVLSTIGTNFTTDFNMSAPNPSGFVWKNATIHVWNSNGSLFNNTTITLTGNNTFIKQYIDSFLVGDYYWNVKGFYGNATFNNYTWGLNNLSFIVGATINSENHNNITFETTLETFNISVSLLEGSELSLAKLVYNGTEYIVTNISITGTGTNTTANLVKQINIPLNVNPFSNQTNSFYWKFTYNGGQVQTLPTYTQVSQPTVLIQCNGTYSTKTLNFTFYDELNQTNLNASNYPVNLLLNFKYWLGDGAVKKNYSFQTLANNTTNSFQFCLYPNSTLYMDMDMQYYSAVSYAERTYYYRNESLTNTTKNVLLYSLLSSEATKFSVNLKEGTEIFSGAIVGVWKYFVGLNSYKLVMVGLTDDKGKFSANLDLDQTYNFTIIKDGISYGSFIKQGTCSVTPCDIDINIVSEIINPNDVVNQYFAQNVIYNISQNDTTQILTLNFQDITGTAQYWRLLVTKDYLNNDTETIICDTKSYSSIGSLTCNYTGYDGDLNAKIYISRSPEKLVVIYNWLNTLDYKTFGDSAILASVILVLVIFFVGIRNPINSLVLIPFALVVLKFIQFLPFSWGWIVGITILDIWLISKLKI